MSMSEFVARFAAMEEQSQLFEALRRIGQLDCLAIQDVASPGWAEWPPADDPGSSGLGMAQA
jgi:hypothetical protein